MTTFKGVLVSFDKQIPEWILIEYSNDKWVMVGQVTVSFYFFLFALNFTDNKRSSEEIFGNEANNLYVVMLSKFNY